MLKQKLSNLIFILVFVVLVAAYSSWKPVEKFLGELEKLEGQVFYIGIIVAFLLYTLVFFVAKYKKWKWFPVFVYMFCAARLIKEIWSPVGLRMNAILEYVEFLTSSFILVIYYINYKHTRYLKEKEKWIKKY